MWGISIVYCNSNAIMQLGEQPKSVIFKQLDVAFRLECDTILVVPDG